MSEDFNCRGLYQSRENEMPRGDRYVWQRVKFMPYILNIVAARFTVR